MNIIRASSADEYLVAFWTRQHAKNSDEEYPDTAPRRLETIIQRYPYKYPFEGTQPVTWHVCLIASAEQLGQLWMHKSDDFLEKHGLLRGSLWLRDLATMAVETGFFQKPEIGSCGKNYWRWKDRPFNHPLDGVEKPLLVQHSDYIDILDGFGRLLPYLALFYQGHEFQRFNAFFAVPSLDEGMK